MSGNLDMPLYSTLTAKTTKYTLEDSKAKVCFVDKLDKGPLNRYRGARN